MPSELRDDVVYAVFKKIEERSQNQMASSVNLRIADFSQPEVTQKELLNNLDYLHDKAYIDAQFMGTEETDTSSSAAILQQAKLTEKGGQTLKKMESHSPAHGFAPTPVPIAPEKGGFLKKVMLEGNLNDIFDAWDWTRVVYPVMGEVMTTEAGDRVCQELHTPSPTHGG
jgi:hypothetical protein